MSQKTIELLNQSWQNSLYENSQSRDLLRELRGIKDIKKLRDLELGLVSIPSASDLPSNIFRSLKSFGIMDKNLTGMISLPLRKKDSSIIGFCFLSLNGSDDRLLRRGGIINFKAFSVFNNLIVVDNLDDYFAYFQNVKENVIPIIESERMIYDFREIIINSNTEGITLINESPRWEHLKEALKETDVKICNVKIQDNMSIKDYLNKNSGNKLIAYLEGEKARLIKKNQDNKTENEKEKEYLKVTENIGEIRFTGKDRSYLIRGFDKNSYDKRVRISLEIDGHIFPDTVDLARHRSRINFANMAASEFEISPEVIRSDLTFMFKTLDKMQDERYKEKRGIAEKNIHVVTNDDVKKAIDRLMSRDLLDEMLMKDTEKLGIVGEEINKKLFYLSAVSRLTGRPVSVLDISPPGTGKSFLMSNIIDLMPQDEVLKFSRLTPNSLYYKSEEELKGKVLYIEELAGMEDSLEAIRMIISAEELAVSSVDKDPRTGQLMSSTRRIKVAIPVLSSGVYDIFDNETMSRFILTYNDLTEKHLDKILKAQSFQYTLNGERINTQRDRILKKHRDIQKVLDKDIVVINEYADRIKLNPRLHIVTRKQIQYLRLIYNIAFLRQYSRKKIKDTDRSGKGFVYIVVTREDIRTANEVMSYVFRFARGDLTKRLHDAYIIIEIYCIEVTKDKKISTYEYKFSRREIREYAGWDPATTKRLFDDLEKLEYIRRVKGNKQGMQYLYQLVPYEGGSYAGGGLQLLDPDSL